MDIKLVEKLVNEDITDDGRFMGSVVTDIKLIPGKDYHGKEAVQLSYWYQSRNMESIVVFSKESALKLRNELNKVLSSNGSIQ